MYMHERMVPGSSTIRVRLFELQGLCKIKERAGLLPEPWLARLT